MSSREIVLKESIWLRNSFLATGLFSVPVLVLLLPESLLWWSAVLLLAILVCWILFSAQSGADSGWQSCLLEDGGKIKLTDASGFWVRVKYDGFWQLGRCVVIYGALPTSLAGKPWRLLFFYDNLSQTDFHYLMRFLRVKWVP